MNIIGLPHLRIIRVEGFDVHINPAGVYLVTKKEGKLALVTLEEYKQKLAELLVEELKTPEEFRKYWLDPQMRRGLMDMLPDGERGLRLFRELTNRLDYDLYDVLAEIGYGMTPKSRVERVEALSYKHGAWLKSLPEKTTDTLLALAKQFERGGTDELENPFVFTAPDVARAGGFEALKKLGNPNEIINETKRRLFAA